MRLIDADKLQAEIDYWNAHDDPKQKDYDTRDIDQIVGFAEEIEAIPIEWIEKWHKEEDRRLGDGWTHIEHPHSHSRMIADWREECERQQSTTSV